MKRLLLLFLLVLLPLQVTWAGVADYCVHENVNGIQHFGHHTDEHKLSYDADDDGTQTGKTDLLHDHCHVSEYTGVLNTHMIAALPSLRVAMTFASSLYPSLSPDKPERPKWTALA